MTKTIAAWAVIAIGAFVVSAAANDLNPGRLRAYSTDIDPWGRTPKYWWSLGTPCGSMTYVWDEDAYFWQYNDYNNPHKTWLLEVFEFTKPEGYQLGILRWRIWASSGNEVSLWHWNEAAQGWDDFDSYTGDSGMDSQYYRPVPAAWFNVQIAPENPNEPWQCYIMAMSEEDDTSPHYIKTDVCDIDIVEE